MNWLSLTNLAMSSYRSWAEPSWLTRRNDAAWLGGFLLTGIYAAIVELDGPRQPARLGSRRLPALCPIRRLTGHRCPTCGMSLGFAYMFRLDARNAYEANVMAPVVFIAAAALTLESVARLLTAIASRS